MGSQRLALTFCLLMVALPNWAGAQDQTGNSIFVRYHHVDRERLAQWEGLMVERMESLRATEQGFRHVFEQVHGQLDTYVIITPYDGPNFAVSTNWVNSLNAVLVDSELQVQRAYLDAFTLELGEDVAVPADFMYARFRTVAPARSNDYYEWQRDELIPAMRSAGVGDTRTLRIVQGGNINTWIRYSYLNDLPVLSDENAVAAAMGERQYQQMMAEGDAMVTEAVDIVYRYRPDLSYDATQP